MEIAIKAPNNGANIIFLSITFKCEPGSLNGYEQKTMIQLFILLIFFAGIAGAFICLYSIFALFALALGIFEKTTMQVIELRFVRESESPSKLYLYYEYVVKGRTIRRRAYLATGIRSLLSCGRYRTVSELEALYPKGSRHSIWYIPCLHIRDY